LKKEKNGINRNALLKTRDRLRTIESSIIVSYKHDWKDSRWKNTG
jgi:hypothetical protein